MHRENHFRAYMNTIAVVLLATLLLKFAVETVAELLNVRASKAAAPPSLADIYKPTDYAKSQAYLRSATRFRLVQQAFYLVVMLVFWLAGGFNWLDGVVRAWGFVPIVTGLFYVGLLFPGLRCPDTALRHLRDLRHRTAVRIQPHHAADVYPRPIKRANTGCPAGRYGSAALLALFQYASSYAWLFAWAAAAVFVLFMQYITPTLIMPLSTNSHPCRPAS